MRLIDELEMGKRPGRSIRLFEFHGKIWRPVAGPEGQAQLSRSKDSTSIIVAARNLWEAHEYVHEHIDGLVPHNITHQGDVWLIDGQHGALTS